MPGYNWRNRRTGAGPPARSQQLGHGVSCLLGRGFGRNCRAPPSLTTILGFVSRQPFEPDQADQRSTKRSRRWSSSTGATGAMAGWGSDALDGPPQPGMHSRVAFANGGPGTTGTDAPILRNVRRRQAATFSTATGQCPDSCVRCVMSVIRAAKVVPGACIPRAVGDVVGFARPVFTTDNGLRTTDCEARIVASAAS
jgi:hypothetical protein